MAFLTRSHRFTSGKFPPFPSPFAHSRRRAFPKKRKKRKIGFRPSNSHNPERKREMKGLFHLAKASEEARER
jgi:hypothetical protein